jgi:hypothetical protein
MRNFSDKSCRENQNTHFVFNIFFSENRAVCEIMRKKKICRFEQATDDNTANALCMPKTTNTHPEYAMLIAVSEATTVA